MTISILSIPLNEKDLSQEAISVLNNNKLIIKTENTWFSNYLKRNNLQYTSLDSLYETSDDFDSLNSSIADYISSQNTDLCYIVFDYLHDTSVQLLKSFSHNINIVPSISASSYYLAKAFSHKSDKPLSFYSCYQALENHITPNADILILEIDSFEMACDLKIKLSDILDEEMNILYFSIVNDNLNTKLIKLYELDMQGEYNHHTAVFIPYNNNMQKSRYSFYDLLDIMARLLSRDGCPWDKQQTHSTLRQYMLEETMEAIQAINEDDMFALCDELGDILLQVVFHCQLASQRSDFNINDSVSSICSKMIRRHEHIFLYNNNLSPKEIEQSWQNIKDREKGITSLYQSLLSVDDGLGALIKAQKVIKRSKHFETKSTQELFEDIIKQAEKLRDKNINIEYILGDIALLLCAVSQKYSSSMELFLHNRIKSLIDQYK